MQELEHEETLVHIGDRIKLRFPEDQFAEVIVVSVTNDVLTISEGSMTLEFRRVMVPFDLKKTILGDVCGELKMWQSIAFPNSAPAMIVENLGRPN